MNEMMQQVQEQSARILDAVRKQGYFVVQDHNHPQFIVDVNDVSIRLNVKFTDKRRKPVTLTSSFTAEPATTLEAAADDFIRFLSILKQVYER